MHTPTKTNASPATTGRNITVTTYREARATILRMLGHEQSGSVAAQLDARLIVEDGETYTHPMLPGIIMEVLL